MERAEISGNELARRLETSQSTVQGWTAGRSHPGGEYLVQLPGILRVSGHWLLTEEGPIEPPGEETTGPYAQAKREADMVVRERLVRALETITQELREEQAAATSPAPAMARVIQEAGDVVRDDQARRRSQPSKPAGRGGKKRKRA